MSNANQQKNTTKMIAAAFGVAMISSTNVSATPTFPERYQDASAKFVESTQVSTIDFAGSYYRPNADSGRTAMSEYASQSGERVAIVAVGITPWYLSNN